MSRRRRKAKHKRKGRYKKGTANTGREDKSKKERRDTRRQRRCEGRKRRGKKYTGNDENNRIRKEGKLRRERGNKMSKTKNEKIDVQKRKQEIEGKDN